MPRDDDGRRVLTVEEATVDTLDELLARQADRDQRRRDQRQSGGLRPYGGRMFRDHGFTQRGAKARER